MKKQTIFLIILAIAAVSVSVAAVFSTNQYPDPGNFQIPTSTPRVAGQVIPAVAPTGIPVHNQPQINDCTYTDVYWQSQPEKWPAQMQIGGTSIDRAEAARLFQATSTDPVQDLERALYVTHLNIEAGANPASIQNTLDNASAWLQQNGSGSPMSEFNNTIADGYKLNLEDYNHGVVGPGLCPGQPVEPSLTPELQGSAGATPTSISGLPLTGIRGVYTARSCDTLGGIAQLFQVKVTSLLAANPEITDPDVVSPGKQLKIPMPELSAHQSIWTGYPLAVTAVPITGSENGTTGAYPKLTLKSHCPAP